MIPREAILEISDKQYRLEWGRTYLIGRTDNDNLKIFINLLNENSVDMKHATICANSSSRSVSVMDLYSVTGTYVNEQQLEAMVAREITADTALGFGTVKAFVKLYTAEESPNSSGFDDDPKTISNSTTSPKKPPANQLSQKGKMQIENIFVSKDETIDSVNNSTVDSFLIPATQFASDKCCLSSAANNSINKKTVEKSAVNCLDNDSSDESFIPETQEFTTTNSVSQRRQRLQASNNKQQSFVTESNVGSQFHICTQDFNENCDGDGFETDSSDLVGDVQCSLVIPHITHEPVVLNDFITSSPKPVDVIAVTADDECEMRICTPDFFDLPGLAQGNSTVTNNNDLKNVLAQENTLKTSATATSEITKTATYCNSIVGDANKGQSSTATTSAIQDDIDLMPTQVFSLPQNNKPEHENNEFVTLSDKENLLPSSAEDVDDNNKKVNPNPLTESTSDEDYLLPATQVFSVQSKAKLSKPATSVKLRAPTATEITATNRHATEVFKRPTGAVSMQKSNSECSNSSGANSFAMDTSMDVLMCTPQFIKDQFNDYLNNPTKTSLLSSKKKALFGDDSDTEEQDIFDSMKAPKISRDFDTLLPHLCQDKTEAKLPLQSKKESRKQKTFVEKHKTRAAHNEEKKLNSETTTKEKQKTSEVKTNIKDGKSTTDARTQGARLRSTASNDTNATMMRVTRTRSRSELGQGDEQAQIVVKATTTTTTKNNKQNINAKEIANSSSSSSNLHRQNQSKESNKLQMRLRSCSPATDAEKGSLPMKRSNRLHTKDELNSSRDQSKTKTAEKVEVEDSKAFKVYAERCKYAIVRLKRLHITANPTESKEKTTEVETKRLRRTHSRDVKSDSTSSGSTVATTPSKLKVSMTMVEPELFERLAQKSADLWTVVKDPTDCDVLIMDKGNRTYKFLLAMARGIPILTSKWLDCVNRKKKFVQSVEYFFMDAAFEKRHKFELLKSLEMARKKPLFTGYEFLLTSRILPSPNELKTIIRCAGGSVLMKPPPPRSQQKVYLISSAQDNKHWHIYRRENSNIRIISTEGVMAAVMRQNPHELDVNLLA